MHINYNIFLSSELDSQMFNYDASTFFFGSDSGICDTIMLCGVHLYDIAKAKSPKAARIQVPKKAKLE